MTEDKGITVRGGEEVISALIQAGQWDKQAAASAAADEMIPSIAAGTRTQSGEMSRGWGVNPTDAGAAFINSVPYWTYQEFGTESVEPTLAIYNAWDSNQRDIKKAYRDEVERQARSAGWDIKK